MTFIDAIKRIFTKEELNTEYNKTEAIKDQYLLNQQKRIVEQAIKECEELEKQQTERIDNNMINQGINNNNSKDDVIELNINKRHWDKKPQGKEIGMIQKEIGQQKTEITIEELANEIAQGATFKAGALNGNKNIDWESQQVFAIDIDNDEDNVEKYGKMLTPEIAYGRCAGLGIRPTFYYHSFSSTEDHPKFRLVFITDTKVTDIRVRNAIQMALMTIFPEADKACKDLSRIFFGSHNRVTVLNDYKDRLNPYILIQYKVARNRKADENGNAGRDIKNYCQSVGLNIINGLPDVKLENDKIDEYALSSIYIYKGERKNVKNNIYFNFNIEEENAKIVTNNNDGKKKMGKYTIVTNKDKYENEIIQHFDFDELENRCELWTEFKEGSRWCYHDEVFGIATNMWRVEGAEKQMIEAIENNDDYKDKFNKINTIKSCRAYGYAPKRCCDFCPYCEECPNKGLNMLHVVDNNRGGVRKIQEAEFKDKEEVRSDLALIFHDMLNDADADKINVIKAPTGIGKTEILKTIEDYRNTVIAVPTHKLAKEVKDRLNIERCLYVSDLEIDNENLTNEYNKLIQIGAFSEAYQLLQDYVVMINNKDYIMDAKEKIMQTLKINTFLKAQKECRVTKKPIICTHSRLLHLNNKNVNTYIIDEDILSTLFPTYELSLDEITKLSYKAFELDLLELSSAFKTMKECIEKSIENMASSVIDVPTIHYSAKEVKEFIAANKDNLTINIENILNIKKIITDKKGNTIGMGKNLLPKGKIIIMSATANETVYRGLLNDRELRFVDLGNVKPEGQILLHYAGFSRSYLAKNIDKAVDKVLKEAPEAKNIITFKTYENHFKKAGLNPITNFGATTGIDAYGGQDLIVAGTPHINDSYYKLIASFIAPKAQIVTDCEYVPVIKNGWEFYFNTFNADQNTSEATILQEIQFYMVESELRQAIGRARVVNNNCTVHVFTNYPLPEMELFK